MVDKCLSYSVFRYVPSKIAGESINIGVLYVDEVSKKAKFSSIKKTNRLCNFDDEIDSKSVLELLKSIEKEVEKSNLDFSIDAFIKFYINSFCFDKPQKIYYEDFEAKVEQLNKVFLRFEYEKSERATRNDEKKLLAEILRTRVGDVKKSMPIIGSCGEKITYDFELPNAYIKFFDFNGKDLSKTINSAKTWAWNGMNSKKKLVIVYSFADEESVYHQEFATIQKIFELAKIETLKLEDIDKIFDVA